MKDDHAAHFQNNLDALWKWTQVIVSELNLSKSHRLTITGSSKRPARSCTIGGEKPLTKVKC